MSEIIRNIPCMLERGESGWQCKEHIDRLGVNLKSSQNGSFFQGGYSSKYQIFKGNPEDERAQSTTCCVYALHTVCTTEKWDLCGRMSQPASGAHSAKGCFLPVFCVTVWVSPWELTTSSLWQKWQFENL